MNQMELICDILDALPPLEHPRGHARLRRSHRTRAYP